MGVANERRIRPTLRSLKPGSRPDPAVTALKPWVRVAITAWVLAVIPLLALALLFAVVNLPRFAATAGDSLALQWQNVGDARRDGEFLGLAAGVLAVGALCLPLLSTVYLLGRVGRRAGRAAWVATGERPVLRRLLAAAGLAAVAGLVWLWWPNGEYRPYQPGERARLQETVRAGSELRSGRPALTEADAARLGGAPFRSSSPTTTAPPVSGPQLEPGGSVPPVSAPSDTGEPTPTTSTGPTQTTAPSTATTLRPATTTTMTTSGTSNTTTSTTPQASTTTTNPTTTESTQP